MSSTLQAKRRAGRCRPGLEGLDARLVLSTTPWLSPILSVAASPVSAFNRVAPEELGPSLTVVEVLPSPGSVSLEAPESFSVTFDRQIDMFSLMYYDDVRLDRLDGGDWVRAYDDLAVPRVEVDPSETRLTFMLSGPLGPGKYRIVLPAGSFLGGADGSFLADVSEDQTLGEFAVEAPGVALADASDLGAILDTPTVVTGGLDFVADPRQVRLYRFTLPEGHRWRLGAEVSAQREGSPLTSALALFDAQGRPIATSNLGRPDAPNDPYLFQGLEPGAYYLGISGRANVPGAPGGYDPVTATSGEPSNPDRGGSFRLDIVADPADEPVKVVGLTLNWADPTLGSPTGLSLTFSGALNARSLVTSPSDAVEVVGADGKTFRLTAVGLHEAGAQYYFLLHEPLPGGRYEVRLVSDGKLADLSGLTPIASGEPAGVLGRFEVRGLAAGPRRLNDLGPLYEEVRDGIHFRAVILPGTAVTYRFVAVSEGIYRINAPGASGVVELNLLGAQGIRRFEISATQSAFVSLKSGVYFLQLVNPGTEPVRLTWGIQLNTLWDSLLENGLGQSPALSLRLATPSATGFYSSPPETALGPASTPFDAIPPTSPIGPFGPIASINPGLPTTPLLDSSLDSPTSPGSGLLLTFAGTPVGLPGDQANHVAVVGPGTIALASNAPGLLDGIGFGQSVSPSPSTSTDSDGFDPTSPPRGPAVPRKAPATPDEVADSGLEGPEGATPEVTAAVNGAIVPVAAQDQSQGDAGAIAAADWLSNLGTLAARWISPGADPSSEAAPTNPEAEPIVLSRDDRLPASVGRVEKADFSTPLVVSVGAVMAMRYAQPIRHWVRRKRFGPVAVTKAGSDVPFRGPHRRS